jgi:hypothetical protein
LVETRRLRSTAVDEPKRKLSWLEWGIIIALVVAAVIAYLVLLGPQTTGMFTQVNNNF